MSGKQRSVLVLGDYRQTVTIVRSLARAGFRITLGTSEWHSSTALSRYVSQVRVFEESDAEYFLDQLEAHLRREKPDYVFPVGETQARRIACAAGRFMGLAIWVMPDPATVLRCFDKRELYKLTPELGIPTVPWCEYTDSEDWAGAAREMGFPVVVKRKDSSASVKQKKALILRSPRAFDTFLDELRREPDAQSLVLQKFAPGQRHNCHIAADQGRVLAYFQQKVLRTDEFDGTGIGVAGVSVAISPDLRNYCERLVGALGYHGIGCVQFMVDENSGSVAFLEMNPRMDSTAALPYRLGYDFPRIAMEIAARAPVPHSNVYLIGKRYHWLYGETVSWFNYRKKGRPGGAEPLDWALTMIWSTLTSYHLTWELRDPIPTLHLFWRKFFGIVLKRLASLLRPVPRTP